MSVEDMSSSIDGRTQDVPSPAVKPEPKIQTGKAEMVWSRANASRIFEGIRRNLEESPLGEFRIVIADHPDSIKTVEEIRGKRRQAVARRKLNGVS